MIKAAVCSARRNTWLQPHLIYDGEPSGFTRDLQELGVTIIWHRSSLYPQMEILPNFPLAISAGAYLRVDIPWLEPDDDYALYTDCDVLFRTQPAIMHLRPALFACAPQMNRGDPNDINTGVMLINIKAMRRELPAFSRFIVENLQRFSALSHDQSALQEFFAGRYEQLPDEMNWKPYWGASDAAQIVHFHGPKPGAVRKILADPAYPMNAIWRGLLTADLQAYEQYVHEWDTYVALVEGHLASTTVGERFN